MKLVETVTYCGPEGCTWVSTPLYSLCVPSGFGGRAGSDVNTNYIFPQAANTLVGGRGGDGVARGRARCELGFLLCPEAITTLFRAGHKLLEQKPEC